MSEDNPPARYRRVQWRIISGVSRPPLNAPIFSSTSRWGRSIPSSRLKVSRDIRRCRLKSRQDPHRSTKPNHRSLCMKMVWARRRLSFASLLSNTIAKIVMWRRIRACVVIKRVAAWTLMLLSSLSSVGDETTILVRVINDETVLATYLFEINVWFPDAPPRVSMRSFFSAINLNNFWFSGLMRRFAKVRSR